MRKFFLGTIFIASFLMPLTANAWDLQKLEDAHNFNCGVVWEINKEAASKAQMTIGEEAGVKNIASSMTNEFFEQDRLWVSAGHSSYIKEISVKAMPRVILKIMGECKKNPLKNMADQVDEYFKKFAISHWNPFTDPELNALHLDDL